MFHNYTNQIPVFALNRNLPDDPPPRYTRNAHGSRLFDPSTHCLFEFVFACLFPFFSTFDNSWPSIHTDSTRTNVRDLFNAR